MKSMALSTHDSSVLHALFDSESSPASASSTANIDTTLPPLPSISLALFTQLQANEVNAIRPLDAPNPPRDAILLAISQLTNLIDSHPANASACNNRAQALRMLYGDDLLQHDVAASSVLASLNQAIELASPSSPTSPVSPFQAKVLASSHTQYAHLFWKASKSSSRSSDLPQQFRGRTKEELEEMASRHFALGARYGNQIAKEMAVRTNPYAKLCGSIVKEAMRKELEEGGLGKAKVNVQVMGR